MTGFFFNPLLPEFIFIVVFRDINIGSFRLPTHSRDAHRNFFMIPSYFRIENMAIRAILCALGSKGLNQSKILSSHPA